MSLSRTSFVIAHRWLGVVLALPLIIVALTGAILAFEKPLDRFFNRDAAIVTPREARLSYDALIRAAREARPDDTFRRFQVPAQPSHALVVETKTHRIYVDPYTAQVLAARDVTADVMWNIVELHTSLFVSPQLTAISALLVIVNALMGFVVWFPRKGDKLRGFKIAWRYSWARRLYDIHSAAGGWGGWMLILLAITGVTHTYKKGVRSFIGNLTREQSILDNIPETTGAPQSIDALMASPLADLCRDYDEVTVSLAAPWRFMCQTPGRPLASIYFDPETLTATAESSQRTSTRVDAIYLTNYPLHVGAIGGVATQILWCIGALLGATLPITGVVMWQRKLNRKRAKDAH